MAAITICSDFWTPKNKYSLEKCKSKPQWDITLHLPEWLLFKKLKITIVGEVAEKLEPRTVGGNAKWCCYENSKVVPQKLQNRATIWLSNPNTGYISKGNEISILKRYLNTNVHCSIIQIAKRGKQPKHPSVDESIKKMWHIMYYSIVKWNGIIFSL